MKAFKSGPIADVEISDEAFGWARRRYYELMQWDPETGVPSEACLAALELQDLLKQ